MELSCEKCQTRYRLDDDLVPAEGRQLRCTRCGHVWHYLPAPPATDPVTNVMGDDPEKGAAPAHDTDDTVDFGEMLAESMSADEENEAAGAKPSSIADRLVLPPAPEDLPVYDARPFNLSANQFGLCAFLLMVFATLAVLLVAREGLVDKYPSLLALYEPAGIKVATPGAGLRLSDVAARTVRVDNGETDMAVSMTVANISPRDTHYPSLKVVLKNAYGAALKDWEFHPAEMTLAAGEDIPVNLTFQHVPDNGKTVDIRVIRR